MIPLPKWKLRARELFWRGLSVEQIAGRVGVTSRHVEAALFGRAA